MSYLNLSTAPDLPGDEKGRSDYAAGIRAALRPEPCAIPEHPSTKPEWRTMLNPARESALRIYTEAAQRAANAILSRPGMMTPEEKAFIQQGLADLHRETGGRW
jgi:hypothetical protein